MKKHLNQKLIGISLTLALFAALCGTALAAPANRQEQPQDALWQYIQGSDAFWDDIMKQVGGSRSGCGQNQNAGQTQNTNANQNANADQNTNSGTNSDQNTNSGTNSSASYAEQILQLVNKERAAQGLSSLKLDGKVSAAAQVRAAEAARLFSHTRPNGTSCFTALKEGGVSYRRAGENIAYGQKTPTAVMRDWLNSPGHRANILNPNYTTLGVGYAVINGTPYWAQFFVQ